MVEKIWAVIAAKDEAKHIAKVVKESKKYASQVLVVDDGSNDNTAELAKKAGAIVLVHIVNMGKGAAIKTGCEYAITHGSTALILLDADMQHDPKDIKKFKQALKKVDIAFGVRHRRKSMPLILKFGNWGINLLTRVLFGINLPDTQCGFRGFKSKIYRKIKWQSADYSLESEMISNVGRKRLKYAQIPITTVYSDKYKGTTVIDGIKIVANLVWWRISRW